MYLCSRVLQLSVPIHPAAPAGPPRGEVRECGGAAAGPEPYHTARRGDHPVSQGQVG